MLWVVICEIFLGRERGSISAVAVGDGARYWRLIEAGVEYGETIKNPCGGRGLVGCRGFRFVVALGTLDYSTVPAYKN